MKFKCSMQKNSFQYYILVVGISICILWNSGYTLAKTEQKISLILLIFLLIGLLTNKVFDNTFTIKKNNLLIGIFIFSFWISLMVNYSDANLNSTILYTIIVLCAVLLVEEISFSTFSFWYVKIMCFMVIVSILALVILRIVGLRFLPTFINSQGVAYYNGYFFFFMFDRYRTGIIYNRCMGPFWEPGVFASYLLFAIIIEVFFLNQQHKSRKSIVILTVGVFLTQSTAGILLLIIIWSAWVMRYANKNTIVLTMIFFGILCLVLIFRDGFQRVLLSVNYEMFYKLFSYDNATTGTRILSPLTNLKIWFDNPVFGQGFSQAESLYASMMRNHANLVAQTSSSTQYLASIGLAGSLYSVLVFLGVNRLRRTSRISKIMLSTVVLMILNKEPHMGMLLTYCILFYFYKYKEEVVNVYDKESKKVCNK